ncbi:TetR/AcrR family transcriptional regulator [Paenibacillus mendelii]|uniref:TetR/AcrR family transcriptional regulator n=1 Tax=Paenibacillus mendelii TaxID=206163 RepID=A0ABV6JJJ2_9BACL|nr:TetR/AcrR family transcriptional regulator [Paenibacillus mendelii]MCQ6558783.1 TetR/AcrR family transcriptional regulator [Paenibacillus mendelii]
MTTTRKKQTEEMKAAVRSAAEALFAERGYQAVTMREIAKAAGCSHTAIYLYYKNKEDLLQQIAIPSLMDLNQRMLDKLADQKADPLEILIEVCEEYVVFCLTNSSFYTVLFAGSVRVDEKEPELEANRIRNRLFGHLDRALRLALTGNHGDEPEAAINRTRALFFMVQGYVSTYSDHVEPLDEVMERTLPYLEQGIRTLVAGMVAHTRA